jgi:hypothetical protein
MENLKEDKGVYARIILKWTLKKQDGRAQATFMWIRMGTIFRLL